MSRNVLFSKLGTVILSNILANFSCFKLLSQKQFFLTSVIIIASAKPLKPPSLWEAAVLGGEKPSHQNHLTLLGPFGNLGFLGGDNR